MAKVHRSVHHIPMMTGVTRTPKGPMEWIISVEGAHEAGIHPDSPPRDRDRGVGGNRLGISLVGYGR